MGGSPGGTCRRSFLLGDQKCFECFLMSVGGLLSVNYIIPHVVLRNDSTV